MPDISLTPRSAHRRAKLSGATICWLEYLAIRRRRVAALFLPLQQCRHDTRRQAMWFVGKSELLALIERNCLEEVMPAFSDHRSLRKNALIYRPEEQSEYVYLLKVGHVRLYRLTEEGQEITLSFIKAGMIFGDGDVLNEASYSHYAETLSASRICYIRKA